MIVHRVTQGEPEWKALRLGVPTASQAKRILTATYKVARTDYVDELMVEWILGAPADEAKSGWMDRGNDMEEEARLWYEMEHDVDTELVGFVTTDDATFGYSPDFLVGDDGLGEIKVPSAKKMVQYWRNPSLLVKDYRIQVLSGLWACEGERKWCDLIAYNPNTKIHNVVVRVEQEPAFVDAWEPALTGFLEVFDGLKKKHAEEYEAAAALNPFA